MPTTNGHGSKPERLALYLRTSSEEQRDRETIETQADFLEEYCKLYRHEIGKVYKDAGVSGTVPLHERPAGRELLEDARGGKFDIAPAELQDAAIARLKDNKRYSGGRPVRKYLLRGLIRCGEHDWRYSGTARKSGGGYLFKYLCPVSVSRRFDPHTHRGNCPTLDALWLEDLVWQDIRRFAENPGEVLERAKEQMQQRREQTGELEERLASLTKRLASARGEKDKYVKLYAAGHLDEEELEEHLSDLSVRTHNLQMLIEATQADLAREEQDAAATRDAAAWLATLRGNLQALEEDTDEAWHGRRALLEQLVKHITVSRTEDGRTKVHITYRFARPVQAANGVTNNKTFEILSGDAPIREALERI